ncbi:hypothetical protein LA080_013979 [Diaporthe eres]|nr:hypothetical protein LA080_013979 [Diaporthe eres]
MVDPGSYASTAKHVGVGVDGFFHLVERGHHDRVAMIRVFRPPHDLASSGHLPRCLLAMVPASQSDGAAARATLDRGLVFGPNKAW